MSLLSILFAVVAVVCTILGFLTAPIPVLGVVFSFGAAAVALGGIMLGGRAMSKAKRLDAPTDTARIAVVLNVLALVPALLVALTCGVCNALVTTGGFQGNPNFRFKVGTPGLDLDPDVPAKPLAPPARAADAGAAETGQPSAGDAGAGRQPVAPAPPASNLPPPPLPAGPGK